MAEPTKQLQTGLKWLGLASVAARVIDVASVFVVWKFLTSAEVGIAALCASVVAFADAFSGFGVGYAIVQSPRLSQRKFSTAYWTAGAVGVFLALVVAGISPLLAAFFEEPAMIALTCAWTLKLVFAGFTVGPMEKIQRDLRFPQASAANVGGAVASTTLRVVTAALGGGAWAFALGDIGRYGYMFLHTTIVSRMGSLRLFAKEDLRELLDFGVPLMFSQGIFEFYRQVDIPVVGALFGTDATGIYRVAKDLATAPLQAIMLVANRVAFPVFSRHADSPRVLLGAFYTMTRYLSTLVGPVTVFLFVAAEDVIAVMAKPEWIEAATPLRILCVAYFLRVNAQLLPELFRAVGRPRWLLFDAALSLVTLAVAYTIAAVWFGADYGVEAICYAALFSFPLVLIALLGVGARVFSISPAQWLKSMLASLPVTVIAACLVWVTAYWLTPRVALSIGLEPTRVLRLLVALAATLASYAINLPFTRRMRERIERDGGG
ncbi:MAG: lipopolysaccharide biosynthesis protein [Myxococcales bacterium]|nr:lipopolysaccharide biosynthesis protein [Myxococcales bacterium]